MIRRLAAEGKTILVSSHILTELAEMCDMVGIIEQGRMLAVGSVAEIQRARPAAATVPGCRCACWAARRRQRQLADGARRRARIENRRRNRHVCPRWRRKLRSRFAARNDRRRFPRRGVRQPSAIAGRCVHAGDGGLGAIESAHRRTRSARSMSHSSQLAMTRRSCRIGADRFWQRLAAA